MSSQRLIARLRRLYSAHERAGWKFIGKVPDSLRRSRKAREILAVHINVTEEQLDALRGW